MRTRMFFFSLLVVLTLALSACAGAPASTTQTRTLNVNGSAQVSAEPDMAYITVGVHTENANAAEAVAANNGQVQKVMDALKAMGVDAKDLQTANLSVYPQDIWTPEGVKSGTTFLVDNSILVTVRDLSKFGDLLGAAVNAGANTISGISFDTSKKAELIEQARGTAIQNAKAQAEAIAAAAGVTLGPVQNISYYNSIPMQAYDVKAVGGAALSSVPVSGGQLTFTVDVSMSYEIK